MPVKRSVLWILLITSLVMLFENWQHYNGRPSFFFSDSAESPSAPNQASQHLSQNRIANDVPQTDALSPSSEALPSTNEALANFDTVELETDVYKIRFNLRGAVLSHLDLKRAPVGVADSSAPPDHNVTLFDQASDHTYLARTGLTGGAFPNHNDLFTALPGPRTLAPGQKTLEIKFVSPVKEGIKLIKSFVFTRGSYVVDVRHTVINTRSTAAQPSLYMEIVRDSTPVETPRFSQTFIGPAMYSNQEHFQKISFSDIDKNKAHFVRQADNGWIAMVQHYFASAWIPQPGSMRTVYIDKPTDALYRIGVKTPFPIVQPGATEVFTSQLFAGPQEEKMLEGIAPGLELMKDYGWVTLIAKPLFWLLEKIYGYLGNWGWSIIGLTILIKAAFFPLSATSYRSMARMKTLMPRMQALRARHKENPKKLNTELMQLYKTEKVNPFGGCLPILIQIPVFISLYWVLLSSVEMQGAPWLGWIHDLSRQDPYFILPVLMAVSMFVQTKLNPAPADPLQAKLMMIMPLVFSAMFFFFPAGLVLYYVVNNLLSILQQWYITNRMSHTPKNQVSA